MPWRIAFSTSGCSSRLGTRASQRLLRHVDVHAQAVREAHLLDRQVALQELQLLPQRDLGLLAAQQRHAQQVAQARQHAVGRVRVLVDQRRDRVERVEQEMGLQLHRQRQQARLGQPRLRVGDLQLALAVLAEHAHAVLDPDDGPVGEEAPSDSRRPA
jgi:hypothetical protein